MKNIDLLILDLLLVGLPILPRKKIEETASIQIFFYMHSMQILSSVCTIFLLYLSKINIRHTSIFSCYVNIYGMKIPINFDNFFFFYHISHTR